jgi:hypothetical protein
MPDAELLTALKLAKSKKMFFAFIPKGSEGKLIVSRKRIPPKAITDAKKEIGGGPPVTGKCIGPLDGMVFEVAKAPAPTLGAAIKKVAKRDTGLSLVPAVQTAADADADEDQANSANGAPAAVATPAAAPASATKTSAAGAPPPAAGTTPSPQADASGTVSAEDVKKHLEKLAEPYKNALATFQGADLASLKSQMNVIKALFAKKDWASVATALDRLETFLNIEVDPSADSGTPPAQTTTPPADDEADQEAQEKEKADQEAQENANSINETIKKKGDVRLAIARLAKMDMLPLLKVLTKLKQAGTLEALTETIADVADGGTIPDRVGAAILTVQGQFDLTWQQLLAKLGKPDRQAILARTPPDVKTKAGLDKTDDDDDPPGVVAVGYDPKGNVVNVDVQANLKWHSSLTGGLGETTFTVHVGPGGKLSQFELDVTMIKGKIEDLGILSEMLDLDVELDFNATADNKAAVNLDPAATRVIMDALKVKAKAEIQAKFKTIPSLKKVAFKATATAGKGGVDFQFSIEIPIPSL